MRAARCRGRWFPWLWTLGLLAALGCGGGGGGGSGNPEPAQACKSPLRGKRYAVCGHLSTVPPAPAVAGGRAVQGSVDSTTPPAAGARSLTGGTFHAQH